MLEFTLSNPIGADFFAPPDRSRAEAGPNEYDFAEFAADLWGSVLQSSVPVYVGAQFTPLGANVLGSAGASFIFRNEPEFPVQNTWFSSALADALTGRDLNPGFTDIGSNFSTDFTFYYGLDGNTPAGQTSFLDVVMHEFGHGLGF